MKRIALVAGSLFALSGGAVLASGCGSSEASSRSASTAGTPPAREAASKPAPVKCPERDSRTAYLTIINKTESVLYPSAENWICSDWSGWGNPSVLNGWAIGPGQEKRLRLEGKYWVGNRAGLQQFTINFRFGTNIGFRHVEGWPIQMQSENGRYDEFFWKCPKDGYSRLFPGRFGPNTMRATYDCSGTVTLEQVAPEQPPA
ncbi:MAG: hypothetical protein KGQ95_04135 [Acidobacteria bacterium]|nr:hypothetical protein [Acidobacteriota bacterium]